jgi:hypothetical protein
MVIIPGPFAHKFLDEPQVAGMQYEFWQVVMVTDLHIQRKEVHIQWAAVLVMSTKYLIHTIHTCCYFNLLCLS